MSLHTAHAADSPWGLIGRLSLRGFRFIDGAPEGGDVTAEDAPPAGDTPPAPEAKHDRLNQLSTEELRAEVVKLRDENASKRTAAAAAAQEAAAAKADAEEAAKFREGLTALIGGKPGDAPPTADELAKTLQDRDAALAASTEAQTTQARENAVLRLAPSLNANADRLLDSRAFTTSLSGVDPTDTAAVKAAIEAALKTSSAFALNTVPGSSGGGAGHGTGPASTPLSLGAAVAQAYTQ